MHGDVDGWGSQVWGLITNCQDHPAVRGLSMQDERWLELPYEIGVDSGQAGVFDTEHYQDDTAVIDLPRVSNTILCADQPWYSMCCDRTFSEQLAGVIPFGAVARSGFGDGGYGAKVILDESEQPQLLAVMIEFIRDEDIE